MSSRLQFRNMMADPDKVIQAVGAHNGLSAKLVEQNGFDAVWASGFEISAASAKPDANILSMVEFLEASSQMVDAVSIPIVADCDTGFGNVNNVIHMIKAYEKSGVAAVCIEDKVFPKVNSFIPGRQELAPIGEFCSKIKAAKDTQNDPNFAVIARVEALIAGHGMEEALERAHAYREAGADMILIHSKQKTPAEIFTFASQWNQKTPLVIVPTTYSNIQFDEIHEHGIKMVIYANQGMRAAVKAMNQVLGQLKKTNSIASIDNELASMDDIFELQGMKEMLRQEKMYEKLGIPNI
ncbi:MAG: phosphoenolpyruvate mutase [Tumebacillaceae bacterium]